MHLARIALAVAASGALLQAGCSLTRPKVENDPGPPAMSYSYSTGRGVQDFGVAPAVVKGAVFDAMDDLKMTVSRRSRDGAVSQIDGRTDDDRSVTVTIRPRQGVTRVACRIGWFGDDPLSRTLLERVGIRLGTLPPAPLPEEPPSAPSPNPIFSRNAIPDSVMLRDRADDPYRDRPEF